MSYGGLALPWLYCQVVDRFATEGTNVPQSFGWRDPARKDLPGSGSNRICWYPGDADGILGEITAAKYPGQSTATGARPLATLLEQFTIEVYGFDPAVGQREVELAQYAAARLLFDAWYRAAYLAAKTSLSVLAVEWLVQHKERRFGAGLRATCTIEARIPDSPYTDANQDAATGDGVTASIATQLLDVTETDNVKYEPEEET